MKHSCFSFLTIIVSVFLSFPAFGQYYYFNKGLEYQEIGWYDSAFFTFSEGVSHGEAASAFFLARCYLRELGTPINVDKAEALMEQFYTKDPMVCILAANYYAGYDTYYWEFGIKDYVTGARNFYSNRPLDYKKAVKFAKYHLEHWEIKPIERRRSGSIDAFNIINDFEVTGLMTGKFGYQIDLNKAVQVYNKYHSYKVISDRHLYEHKQELIESDIWMCEVFCNLIFHSKNPDDFIAAFHTAEDKFDHRHLGGSLSTTMLWFQKDRLRIYRRYEGDERPDVNTLDDIINKCTTFEQLSEIKQFLDTVGEDDKNRHILDYWSTLEAKIQRVGNQFASEWINKNTGRSDIAELLAAESPSNQSMIKQYFYTSKLETISQTSDTLFLEKLRNNALSSKDLIDTIDERIRDIKKDEWSRNEWEKLSSSSSIRDYKDFIDNELCSTSYRLKANDTIRLLKKQQKSERDKALETLKEDFEKALSPVYSLNESEIMYGAYNREKILTELADIIIAYQSLVDGVEQLNASYPDIPAITISKEVSINKIWSFALSISELASQIINNTDAIGDYMDFQNKYPNSLTNFVADGSAVAQAKALTANSTSQEILSVKSLPVSFGAMKEIKKLTKKSYLKNKH